MNWNKIDLDSAYERNQNFLDGYDFDTLILELICNYRAEDITPGLVRKHAIEAITSKVDDAIDIIHHNERRIAENVKEYHKQD